MNTAKQAPFTCNVCGHRNPPLLDPEQREKSTCATCGSSIRIRSTLLALSRALFGLDLPLNEFPSLKSVCGLGISDSDIYAPLLEQSFNYTNTYYHRQPVLDLVDPDPGDFGRYDFIVCSEVLEHIPPPVDRAFHTLAQLLKPAGVLVLTVPYVPIPTTIEHFPDLQQHGLATIDGTTVLVNRLPGGGYHVHDRLTFHGGQGSTLEMRIFAETDVRALLNAAGLTAIHFDGKESLEHGVVFSGPCSLPVTASRGSFSLNSDGITELVEQWALERKTLEMVRESRWVQLGRRLGIGPKLNPRSRVTYRGRLTS